MVLSFNTGRIHLVVEEMEAWKAVNETGSIQNKMYIKKMRSTTFIPQQPFLNERLT